MEHEDKRMYDTISAETFEGFEYYENIQEGEK